MGTKVIQVPAGRIRHKHRPDKTLPEFQATGVIIWLPGFLVFKTQVGGQLKKFSEIIIVFQPGEIFFIAIVAISKHGLLIHYAHGIKVIHFISPARYRKIIYPEWSWFEHDLRPVVISEYKIGGIIEGPLHIIFPVVCFYLIKREVIVPDIFGNMGVFIVGLTIIGKSLVHHFY